MDEDDIELPVLSRVVLPLPQSLPQGHLSRKRPFISTTKVDEDDLAAAFNTSSDPAFFSSEDTPDLENYSGSKRRKKKVYSGTWWAGLKMKREGSSLEEKEDISDSKQKKFRRNFDSGIFMADDTSASDLSSDPAGLEDTLGSEVDDLRQSSVTQADEKGSLGGLLPSSQEPPLLSGPLVPRVRRQIKELVPNSFHNPQEDHVTEVVRECLRQGREDISLSGLGLDSLPYSVTELKQLTKFGTPGTYKPFVTRLKLFLSNNTFTQFPVPILQLEDLYLLSLRQNQLSEIPPTIRTLRNLTGLNISSNMLQWLPYEMLSLLQDNLRDLQSDPNPWIPQPALGEQLLDVPLLEINDTRLGEFSRSLRRVAVAAAEERCPVGGIASDRSRVGQNVNAPRVPYLTELIARNIAKKDLFLEDPIHAEHFDQLPTSVQTILRTVYACQKGGGRECTFCQRTIVLPRLMWLEWWSIMPLKRSNKADKQPQYRVRESLAPEDQQGQILPFLRMACGCRGQRAGLEVEAKAYQGMTSCIKTNKLPV